jgi:putative ABC transport system permease protein
VLRVALRGLLARKTRLALTALAVALGVTLISGTYVFTDTINSSFDRIFSEAYKGTDVVITPNDDLALNENGDLPPIDAAVLERVRGVDGIEQVEGSIFDQGGTFLTKEGGRAGLRAGPEVHRLGLRRRPLRRVLLRRGPPPRDPGRGRDRQGDRAQGGLLRR